MIDYENCKYIWDVDKHTKNQMKHHVSFQEAKTVFHDKNIVIKPDPEHTTDDEERFFAVGMSNLLKRSKYQRLLLVCHCYRSEDTIRIYSARAANEYWTMVYETENGGEI